RTRQRAADLDHLPPDRPRVEHRVKGHDVLDIRRRTADHFPNMPHRIARDVSLLLLREIQRRQNRRLPLVRRIACADLLQPRPPRPPLGGKDKRRPFFGQRSGGLMVSAAVVHRWVKSHLLFPAFGAPPPNARAAALEDSLSSRGLSLIRSRPLRGHSLSVNVG